MQRVLLTPDAFVRPNWTVVVRGLDDVRGVLGA